MLRHSISFLVVLTIALFLSSCAGHHTAALLDDVETYIQERPDSALATIRAIDTTTLTSRSLRAHFALLHAMALDKNWIDTTDVNVVMPAVEYYDRHGSADQKMKAYYYLGRIQENGKLYEEAGVSFLKSEKYSSSISDDFFKSLLYQSISNVYSETYYAEEALAYTERSYLYSLKAADTIGANASRYRMAQDLNNVGRYAESDSLYRLLINENSIHPNLRASLLSNYALNLVVRTDEFEQAINLFKEVIDTYGSLRSPNYWGAYAYALDRVGQKNMSNSIFKQLEPFDNEHSLFYKTWKSQADAYEGNYLSAYQLQKLASDIQNDNVKLVLRQSAIKAQRDFLKQDNQETEKELRRRQIIAWCSTLLLLMIIALMFLMIKRRKEKIVQEKEQLIEAYKKLTMEQSSLISRYSALNEQVNLLENEKAYVRNEYIHLCQTHFSRIGRINEVLYYHANDKENKLYKDLKVAMRGIGLDYHNINEFERMLNETFDNVMAHFRESFPNKKPRFYLLVSYLFAGFDTSTICAIIPGFKKFNVYVERSRLKQKIQESNSPYKEQFLRQLS
jgi:Uncharacterized protein conserved in bacteria containing a divergent form of TPR repeats